MASSKKKSTKVNVKLSLGHIKRYLDALPFERLPSDAQTDDLVERKKMAEAALAHLTYFFNSRVGDVITARLCGPKPQIPELP